MTLTECLEKHTHRQYLAWMDWLDEEWNRPSRSDFYLMQITQFVSAIINAFSKHPKNSRLKDYRIEFKQEGQSKKIPETPEEATKRMMAVHLGIINKQATVSKSNSHPKPIFKIPERLKKHGR